MLEDRWADLLRAHSEARVEPVDETPAHQPSVAVLACSDARVPPSLVFDQPAGSMFIVRVAGNSASPAVLASLDYAVQELHVPLIIVLGHTSCGAVRAAVAGSCDGHLAPIVQPICALVRAWPDSTADRIGELNVRNTMSLLHQHSGPTGTAARSGAVEIRGAIHDLRTGQLFEQCAHDQLKPDNPNKPPNSRQEEAR